MPEPTPCLALSEALIHSSLSQQGENREAEEALKILEDKELVGVSQAIIWKAEALAALGRYQDAEVALAEIPATHPHFSESQLARARIQLALKSNRKSGQNFNPSSRTAKIPKSAIQLIFLLRKFTSIWGTSKRQVPRSTVSMNKVPPRLNSKNISAPDRSSVRAKL